MNNDYVRIMDTVRAPDTLRTRLKTRLCETGGVADDAILECPYIPPKQTAPPARRFYRSPVFYTAVAAGLAAVIGLSALLPGFLSADVPPIGGTSGPQSEGELPDTAAPTIHDGSTTQLGTSTLPSQTTAGTTADIVAGTNCRLIVKGRDITAGHYVKINYENRCVEFPLTAVMTALGAKVEWRSETTAAVTIDGKEYTLDAANGTLIEAGGSADILLLAPGSRHGKHYQMVGDEFVIDSNSTMLLINNMMGMTFQIDYDEAVVRIEERNQPGSSGSGVPQTSTSQPIVESDPFFIKYAMSVKVSIHNDYMPVMDPDNPWTVLPSKNSRCTIQITSSTANLPPVEVSATVLTSLGDTIQLPCAGEAVIHGQDGGAFAQTFRPTTAILLGDYEPYRMVVTVKIAGEEGTKMFVQQVVVTY